MTLFVPRTKCASLDLEETDEFHNLDHLSYQPQGILLVLRIRRVILYYPQMFPTLKPESPSLYETNHFGVVFTMLQSFRLIGTTVCTCCTANSQIHPVNAIDTQALASISCCGTLAHLRNTLKPSASELRISNL